MLELKNDSWIIRTYRFSEEMKSIFHGWDLTYSGSMKMKQIKDSQTNLCYMCRSVVLCLPFMILVQLATVLMVLAAFVIYPMSRAGWRWWLVPGWIFFGVVVAIVGCLIVVYYLSESKPYKKLQEWFHTERTFGQDTIKVAKAYLQARHESFCPTIKIVGDGEDKKEEHSL